MNLRAWVGTIIWVFGFNLSIAIVAYYYSISWGIIILCLRQVLWGIPKVFNIWRKVVVGNAKTSFQSKPLNKKWPNQMWIVETIICVLLSIGSLLWINYPLKIILMR
jgi:hypothetical protein